MRGRRVRTLDCRQVSVGCVVGYTQPCQHLSTLGKTRRKWKNNAQWKNQLIIMICSSLHLVEGQFISIFVFDTS